VTSARSVARACLLVAFASGCFSRGFVARPPLGAWAPARPAATTAGPLAARLEAVQVLADSDVVLVRLALRASRPALVADARLSSAQATPCAAGASARSFALDGQPRWDRPLGVAGEHEHELVLFYDGAAPLLARADAVLDVVVGDPTSPAPACVRIPLGADGEGRAVLQPARAWSVGGALRAAAPTTRGPIRLIDDELRVSRWLGPVALGVELGWAFQGCLTPCPETPSLELPAWAVVELVPIRGRSFGVGLEGAYGVIFGLESGANDVRHGPRVALHLLELPRAVWGADTQTTARGLEVSLSYERSAAGPLPPAWIVGLGWVAF
jgi:hypothetical protein